MKFLIFYGGAFLPIWFSKLFLKKNFFLKKIFLNFKKKKIKFFKKFIKSLENQKGRKTRNKIQYKQLLHIYNM